MHPILRLRFLFHHTEQNRNGIHIHSTISTLFEVSIELINCSLPAVNVSIHRVVLELILCLLTLTSFLTKMHFSRMVTTGSLPYKGGGVCVQGVCVQGVCVHGVCVQGSVSGGSLSRESLSGGGVSVLGISVQGVSVRRGGGSLSRVRSLCPGSLCPGGLCPGGLCPGCGVSVQGVSVRGVSVQEGLCPGGSLSKGDLCQTPVKYYLAQNNNSNKSLHYSHFILNGGYRICQPTELMRYCYFARFFAENCTKMKENCTEMGRASLPNLGSTNVFYLFTTLQKVYNLHTCTFLYFSLLPPANEVWGKVIFS